MSSKTIGAVAVKIFMRLASDPGIQRQIFGLGLKIASDPEVQKQIQASGMRIFDFIQVKTGQVNLHSLEEAIAIALKTCLRQDNDSRSRVAAFITGLYAEHQIERGAQVGGSLLKRFGKSWFPHIKDRELRFALDVNSELEEYLYRQIIESKQ